MSLPGTVDTGPFAGAGWATRTGAPLSPRPLAAGALLLLLACRPGDELPASPLLVTATGAASLHVPTVLVVEASGPQGVAQVEYGLDTLDTLDQRTPLVPSTGRVVLPVLGLKAGLGYRWRVVFTDAHGDRHASDTSTFETPLPPPELPPLSLEVSEPGATVSWVLASVIDQPDSSAIGIFDRDGDWVWWVALPKGRIVVTPEISPDGRSVVWAEYATNLRVDGGYAVRVAIDGSDRVETRLPLGHHDIVPHDDGTIAYVAMTFGELATDDGPLRIATDQIRSVREGATEADPSELLWDTFTDFPFPAELTCTHMTEGWRRFEARESFEWTHANSLVYVPEEDAYYLNQRLTDWLLKIDRATGELQWIMNGLHGEFTLPNGELPWLSATESRLWSHPHLSDVWPGGALVFDNGDHASPPRSRAIEIGWDEEEREVGVVWEMPHPGGGMAAALGDVRRMPDDHVLITWSGLREVMEVTRDHAIVWQVDLPLFTSIGRLVPLADLYPAGR